MKEPTEYGKNTLTDQVPDNHQYSKTKKIPFYAFVTVRCSAYSWSQPIYESDIRYNVKSCLPVGSGAKKSSFTSVLDEVKLTRLIDKSVLVLASPTTTHHPSSRFWNRRKKLMNQNSDNCMTWGLRGGKEARWPVQQRLHHGLNSLPPTCSHHCKSRKRLEQAMRKTEVINFIQIKDIIENVRDPVTERDSMFGILGKMSFVDAPRGFTGLSR